MDFGKAKRNKSDAINFLDQNSSWDKSRSATQNVRSLLRSMSVHFRVRHSFLFSATPIQPIHSDSASWISSLIRLSLLSLGVWVTQLVSPPLQATRLISLRSLHLSHARYVSSLSILYMLAFRLCPF
jgi:hypothetical protein